MKVVAYNNAGGERYARYINNISSTVFRDVPPEELMRFNNHLLNYGEDEASYDELPKAGLSADYVYRETRRARDGVILSRKYSEMFLANLDAAGRAVRDGTKE
jgi:hypothetical protein